ncbi:MAG: PQQ-dependent sugar dehydrogenase, partial [Chloroflexota bacterium]|nr:PQQ-dependent sugar dehydrogenase [Chloroflexota bacterium]
MHPAQFPRVRLLGLLALLLITSAAPAAVLVGHTPSLQAQSAVRSLRPDIQVHHILDTGTSPASVRLAKDPRTNTLFYLKQNGDIYRVNLSRATSTRTYTTTHHKVRNTQGFALGPDGTMYLVGNEDRPNSQTRATIVKGVPDANGNRVWSTLAQTADYPKSNTAYDHRFNGLVVRPSGSYLFVNSGSRTDHGEIQTAGGLYPATREVGLTACVLRLPTSGHNLSLPNDRAALKQAGYIFAEGTRNSFDLAFAPNGNLFATENGPDRDMSEELNWLRSGRHYGFPWRIGGADNPQQYPDYDPSTDLLLDPRYGAVKNGYYH